MNMFPASICGSVPSTVDGQIELASPGRKSLHFILQVRERAQQFCVSMVLGLLQEVFNAIGDSNQLFSFKHVLSFHKKAGHPPIRENRQMPLG
jgi:hypothetical protein